MRRQYAVFGDTRFERLAGLSNGHFRTGAQEFQQRRGFGQCRICLEIVEIDPQCIENQKIDDATPALEPALRQVNVVPERQALDVARQVPD